MPFAKMKRQSLEKEEKNYGYSCSLLATVICPQPSRDSVIQYDTLRIQMKVIGIPN